MDYEQLTSPCGLDCFNCPMYLANEDISLIAKISMKFSRSVKKARCAGCRSAKGRTAFQGDTEPCAVFRCTNQKNVTYCYECREFPCETYFSGKLRAHGVVMIGE